MVTGVVGGVTEATVQVFNQAIVVMLAAGMSAAEMPVTRRPYIASPR
jgi:hypothetical protein